MRVERMTPDPARTIWQDQLLICAECRTEWVWTATEQELQGTAEPPTRCPACRILAPPPGHQRGVVKWYNPTKGYGFITLASGEELFFHRSSLPAEGAPPAAGDLIQFAVSENERGRQAVAIVVLARGQAHEASGERRPPRATSSNRSS